MSKRAYDNARRAEQSRQTRATIVEAMVHAMASGDEDVIVADLAKSCGVSRRTIYQHFPDKAARVQAITEWIDEHVEMGTAMPEHFDDIPRWVESVVDHVLENETLVRAQMMPGLSKSVRTFRKEVHARHLRAALRERISRAAEVKALTALLLSTVRAEAILDLRDIHGMTPGQIKSWLKAMVEALVDARVDRGRAPASKHRRSATGQRAVSS